MAEKRADSVRSMMGDVLAGRISRREMVKRATAIGISAPVIASMMHTTARKAMAAGDLEIFSWWTSAGEAPALEALFADFKSKYPDVNVVNAAVAGGGGGPAQAVLQSRLQADNPPDSWQTHVGRELIDQYVTAAYCDPVTALYESEGLKTAIPQALIDQVTVDGEQYAIPVGVHRGNTFWYNKDVMATAGVEVADTLSVEEFLAAAEKIKAAGMPALALGDKDAFVSPQTLENTLLGTLGAEGYNGLWTGDTAWDSPEVAEAIEVFNTMLGYINEDHAALSWDGATSLVIEGKAGFNSMGDWAYGEVVAKKAQDKIGYVSHPGTESGFVLVVDCFTLPTGAPNPENATNWLKVCGSVSGQEAFNPLKGSIPARTDVDATKFNEYQKWSIENFSTASLVPSLAHGSAASPAFKQSMYDAVNAYVTDRDAAVLVSTLQDALAAEA